MLTKYGDNLGGVENFFTAHGINTASEFPTPLITAMLTSTMVIMGVTIGSTIVSEKVQAGSEKVQAGSEKVQAGSEKQRFYYTRGIYET